MYTLGIRQNNVGCLSCVSDPFPSLFSGSPCFCFATAFVFHVTVIFYDPRASHSQLGREKRARKVKP